MILLASLPFVCFSLEISSYILCSEAIADLVFKVLLQKNEAYLHLMIEHQSTPDKLMAFCAENYRSNFLAQHVTLY